MIYRMLRRAVWLCCGLGFLGLWKIPPDINGEKHGVVLLQIKPKLDAGSKKVQNKQLNAACKYIVPGIHRFDLEYLINEYSYSGYVHLYPSASKQDYFTAMLSNRQLVGARGFFDKKFLAEIQKKLPSFKIAMLEQDISRTVAHHSAKRLSISHINMISQRDEMTCKHCGEVLKVDSCGDCSVCDNAVVDNMFNVSALTSDILKGKPKSLEKYVKAA